MKNIITLCMLVVLGLTACAQFNAGKEPYLTRSLSNDAILNLDLHANRINFNSMKNFSGTKEENKMSGTINGGGIPITVKTSNGRLSLAVK